MNKFQKFVDRNWINLWFVVAACILASSVMLTYAAYTRDNKAKRVTATIPGMGQLFSSNYLDEQKGFRQVFFGTKADYHSYSVTVCNYAQGNKGKSYEENITYTIAFELVKKDGSAVTSDDFLPGAEDSFDTKKITVSRKGEGQSGFTELVSFDKYTAVMALNNNTQYVLTAGAAVTDTYKVEYYHFDIEKDDYDPVYVKMTVQPQNSGTGELQSIGGAVTIDYRGTQESVQWRGYYNDEGANETNGRLASEYDGYNYILTGSGAGTMTFYWNDEYLEVNQIFLLENGLIGDLAGVLAENVENDKGEIIATAGMRYFTLAVDSENGTNKYSFQLYKKSDKENTDYDTWTEMRGYVAYNFDKGE